jgi:hypothetical protein
MSMTTATPPMIGMKEVGGIIILTEQLLTVQLEYTYLQPRTPLINSQDAPWSPSSNWPPRAFGSHNGVTRD